MSIQERVTDNYFASPTITEGHSVAYSNSPPRKSNPYTLGYGSMSNENVDAVTTTIETEQNNPNDSKSSYYSTIIPNDEYNIFDEFEKHNQAGTFQVLKQNQLSSIPDELKQQLKKVGHKLSQLPATAICGNDITSSILYVVGVCTFYSGMYAPICSLMVSFLLYMYKSIYSEVGGAFPLNGATYTLLLNTTSKTLASLAACLTIISYVATAVVSATSALYYIQLLPYCSFVNIIYGTIILLFIFAVLNLIGITESAIAAFVIFAFHLCCLVILLFYSILYATVETKFSVFVQNWNDDLLNHSRSFTSIISAIFYGFGSSMLGVTGFESSANFIEQQKKGVFTKTLRNMWYIVSFFNPLLSFFILCVLPLSEVADPNNPNLLSRMGWKAGGRWLSILISFDAALVLSGGVITSYVGVVGLVRRMAMDRCMPQFFLRVNSFRKTNHWIIIGFFLVCSSMLVILKGDVSSLSGVYTLSFLSVMFLFALGDLILKYKRGQMRRDIHARKTTVFIAMSGVFIAIISTIMANPNYIQYFAIYYIITACLVLILLKRVIIIKYIIYLLYTKLHRLPFLRIFIKFLVRKSKEINSQSVVFLAKRADIATLNRAILYVLSNELTDWLRIVHVQEEGQAEVKEELEKCCKILDEIYPQVRIDCVVIESCKFSREIILRISQQFNVPLNMVFIGPPTEKFKMKLSDVGGIRVISVK